jgi:hypothetical protein
MPKQLCIKYNRVEDTNSPVIYLFCMNQAYMASAANDMFAAYCDGRH